MRIAVNSFPLIFLTKLKLLNTMKELFDEVYITGAVYRETFFFYTPRREKRGTVFDKLALEQESKLF